MTESLALALMAAAVSAIAALRGSRSSFAIRAKTASRTNLRSMSSWLAAAGSGGHQAAAISGSVSAWSKASPRRTMCWDRSEAER